ncbi:type III pantothenate kinase [Glaciecola sp. 1036]|uniref:type III pantothenate kinase n=1 Tax=Alteromonadaceae TaxID=72275 RepID=UPI003D08CFE6
MSESYSLLIDQGNTHLKTAHFFADQDIRTITPKYTTPEELDLLVSQAKDVYVCSVQSDEQIQVLLAKIKQQKENCHLVSSQQQAFGLVNSYQTVSNMGSDRWMGIVAGHFLTHQDFLVIDAGTAITIDAVVNKHHLGGWITAGIETAKAALLKNTKRVFEDDSVLHKVNFGQDTSVCVTQGAIAQAVGTVLMAVELIKSATPEFKIIISGGNGGVIFDNLPQNIKQLAEFHPNIVLTGLACVSVNGKLAEESA